MTAQNPNVYFEDEMEGEQLQRKFLSFLTDFSIPSLENPNEPFFYYRHEV